MGRPLRYGEKREGELTALVLSCTMVYNWMKERNALDAIQRKAHHTSGKFLDIL